MTEMQLCTCLTLNDGIERSKKNLKKKTLAYIEQNFSKIKEQLINA